MVSVFSGFRETGDEAANVGVRIEKIVLAVQDKDWHLDFLRAGIHAIDKLRECAEEPKRVFFDVVGIGFGLFFVPCGLGNLNVLMACQGIEGDTCQRHRGGGDLNQGNFPNFDIVFEAHNGRGKNEGVTRRLAGRCGVERVGGDETAHTFPIPDDFGFWVAFFYKLGEGVQVVIPLGRIANIATAFVDGITALTAKLVGINGGIALTLDEVIPQIGIIHGGSAKSVNADDDNVLVKVTPFPSTVSKRFFGLFAGEILLNGVISGCAAAKSRHQEA